MKATKNRLGAHIEFSRKHLLVFVALFAFIGGAIIWSSFAAAPLVAQIEGESMTFAPSLSTTPPPSGAYIIPTTFHGRYSPPAGQTVTATGPLTDITIRVSTANVTIKNVHITGGENGVSRPAIIDASGATNLLVENVTLLGDGKQEQGIYQQGGSGMIVRNSVIGPVGIDRYFDHPFYLNGNSNFLIDNVTAIGPFGAAVQLYSGNATGTIRNCDLKDSRWGIVSWGSGNVLNVENCWIHGSRMIENGRGYGIECASGGIVNYKNSYIWDNQAVGNVPGHPGIMNNGSNCNDQGGNIFTAPPAGAQPPVSGGGAVGGGSGGGSQVISDTSASGGQSIRLSADGVLSKTVNFSGLASTVSVVAKGSVCGNIWPRFSVQVDDQTVFTADAGSVNWAVYSGSVAVTAGNHTVKLVYANSLGSSCTRNLDIDQISFYGTDTSPGLPTITLLANPTSVNTGQSSNITWNTTNATSCTASGAWSGAKSTSGSQSVSPTVASTYSLTCVGTGGSTSTSTTVSVATPPPPPAPDTTPPTVSFSSPANGSSVSAGVNVQAIASDNIGVSKVEFYLDGSFQRTEAAAPYCLGGDDAISCSNWDSTTVTSGSHTFTAKAYDAAGNSASSQVIVLISNTPPSTKPADLNGDNQVNVLDLSILLSNYGTNSAVADINKDGAVSILDLSILLSNFGL